LWSSGAQKYKLLGKIAKIAKNSLFSQFWGLLFSPIWTHDPTFFTSVKLLSLDWCFDIITKKLQNRPKNGPKWPKIIPK
jgi:hypothetical protein